jgi:hypothetical protein
VTNCSLHTLFKLSLLSKNQILKVPECENFHRSDFFIIFTP